MQVSTSKTAIDISQLIVKDKGIKLLDGLDLSIQAGTLLGIMDVDHTGAQALMEVLSTTISGYSGSVRFYEMEAKVYNEQLRKLIAYIPEHCILYEDLTVGEHLRLFASIRRVDLEQSLSKIGSLYEQLAKHQDKKAGQLSGGMRRKLQICCAIIHQPNFVFLNKPTTGIDPVARQELWGLLSTLREQGKTVVYSTEDMSELRLSEKLLLLQHGKAAAIGPLQHIAAVIPFKVFILSAGNPAIMLAALRKCKAVIYSHCLGQVIRFAVSNYSVLPEVGYEIQIVNFEREIIEQEPDLEDIYSYLKKIPAHECYRN